MVGAMLKEPKRPLQEDCSLMGILTQLQLFLLHAWIYPLQISSGTAVIGVAPVQHRLFTLSFTTFVRPAENGVNPVLFHVLHFEMKNPRMVSVCMDMEKRRSE